jgi:hypothetical protein
MDYVRVAAKWGAVVGVVAYLALDVTLTLLGNLIFGTGPADLNTNPGKLTLGCLSIFALLFAFSVAGYYAGRDSLRAGAGALAGMITFAVYALLGVIYEPGRGASPATNAPFFVQLVVQISSAFIVLAIAAGMGWLGGRPGAQRALRQRTAPSLPVTEHTAK